MNDYQYEKPKININLNAYQVLGLLVGVLVATWAIAIGDSKALAQQLGNKFLLLVGGEKALVDCNGTRMTTSKLSPKSILVTCLGTAVTPTPTPSITPTPTVTPSGTPTPSGSPTPTITPTPGQISARQLWHAPGAHDGLNTHEHGDKPPVWADEFSQKNFGHPVIYGGDEATANENVMKHQAYKGFLMPASATGGVDVYIRYHAASNPHDRAFYVHSYETFAKDKSNNVSFWQGWIFYGYPEQRSQRMARHNEQGGFDPTNGITWPGRGQFIISGADKQDWDNYLRCEQWYGHAGLWSWDNSITICGATTFFTVDEHLTDFANKATWKPTGSLGGSRRLEISHYGPSNPLIKGENLPFDKWFCAKLAPNENRATGATPTWSITGAVDGPNSCASGWLPEFVAGTFPKEGVYFQTGNTLEKTFPTDGVTLPN